MSVINALGIKVKNDSALSPHLTTVEHTVSLSSTMSLTTVSSFCIMHQPPFTPIYRYIHQRKAMVAGNRPLCFRGCEQVARRQQVRLDQQEGCRVRCRKGPFIVQAQSCLITLISRCRRRNLPISFLSHSLRLLRRMRQMSSRLS